MSASRLSVPCTASPLAAVLENLRLWSDAGWLRHLDSAFAAFIAELDPHADTALIVAAAMLSQLEGRGHGCLPLAALGSADPALFAWPADALPAVNALWHQLPTERSGWIAALRRSPAVHFIGRNRDDDGDRGQPLLVDGPDAAPRLYLRRYWHYEQTVANAVAERCTTVDAVDEVIVRNWLDRLFPSSPATTVDWQKLACAIALRARMAIVTGGPGTGKTYTAARLLALLLATSAEPQRLRIALAAPTGKAAARLKQSIDASLHSLQASLGDTLDLAAFTDRIGAARTLHSLLGARPDTRRLRHHAGNPLDVDVLIVDEASMVHLEMMAAVLAALPASARLILLGDKDQLASVEAGAVLGDLCRNAQAGNYSSATANYLAACSGASLPPAFIGTGTATTASAALAQQTVMLRVSRRFDGPIGALAQAVNDARDSARPARLLQEDESGVLFLREGGAPSDIIELCIHGRPGAAACYRNYLEVLQAGPATSDSAAHAEWAAKVLTEFDRFRVLCAVREGDWGVAGLNRAIEHALAAAGLLRPQGSWYVGRPVMVTRNDSTLGVFNGDIGIVLPAPDADGHNDGGAKPRVCFLDGERLRSVAASRLAHVETAFALTVHKSQGSEFEHTALVLSAHSGSVLTRELIYTAITRARKAFSLFAEQPGLLESGVAQATRRESGLMVAER